MSDYFDYAHLPVGDLDTAVQSALTDDGPQRTVLSSGTPRRWLRSRAVPTGNCPSGPCGCREEVATWYTAKPLTLPEYYERLEKGLPLSGAETLALDSLRARQGDGPNIWIFTEGFREP